MEDLLPGHNWVDLSLVQSRLRIALKEAFTPLDAVNVILVWAGNMMRNGPTLSLPLTHDLLACARHHTPQSLRVEYQAIQIDFNRTPRGSNMVSSSGLRRAGQPKVQCKSGLLRIYP